MCKKIYIWNPAACSCKNGKSVEGVIVNSVIACDGIIEKTKNYSNKSSPTEDFPINFNGKKVTFKTKGC